MSPKFKSAIIGALALAFALPFNGSAQTKAKTFTARNAVFVELGGKAGRYAASYGRIFHQKGKLKLSGSVGFSIWRHQIFRTYWLPVLPLEISAFWGHIKA